MTTNVVKSKLVAKKPAVAAKPSVTAQERERIEKDINSMFLRKAKVLAHKLDRAGVPRTSPQRTFQVAPKWLAEAKRVGITSVAGLKLV